MNHAPEENKDFLHVLIIGNGFDLAHGLKTKYTDFLDTYTWDYCVSLWFIRFSLMNELEKIGVLKNRHGENWCNLEQEIYKFIRNPDSDKELIGKLQEHKNALLSSASTRYYQKSQRYIDIDSYLSILQKYNLHTFLDKSQDITTFIKASYEEVTPLKELFNTFDSVYGLRSFVEAFAKYLSQTVSKSIETLIKNLENQKFLFYLISKESEEENTNFQKHKLWVLNFNYTQTFEQLYEKTLTERDVKVEHCHIHGALGEGSLVLGCQSFNTTDKTDKIDPAWNVFTKYHQRHRYGTIDKYQELLKELSHFKGEIAFHILGHSLDHADHAILKHALCSSHNIAVQDSFITVYYHDEEAHLRLINNITDIIGEEAVMARVRFIDQYDPKRGILRHLKELNEKMKKLVQNDDP